MKNILKHLNHKTGSVLLKEEGKTFTAKINLNKEITQTT
jgi:hypothetical protein